ncbi:hypothetical protein BSKO_13848 [Bryopsis sp. KO-2023]|nr:hypothetical protein BSKO_13848 [Bryopsis sp. KO-2023]
MAMSFASRSYAGRLLFQLGAICDGGAISSVSSGMGNRIFDSVSTCTALSSRELRPSTLADGDGMGGRRSMCLRSATSASVKRFLQEVERPAVLSQFPELEKVGVIKSGYSVQPQLKFAVIQLGAHQFKVTTDDVIYIEKIKGVDVMDKVRLGRVLLVGTDEETMIGRPFIPGASVLAAIEEQCQDAKVLIFKKKRRKTYRRTKGHRQELTGLRILKIFDQPPRSKSVSESKPQTEDPQESGQEVKAATG